MRKIFDFIASLKWDADSSALGKFNKGLDNTMKTLGKVALAATAAGTAFLLMTQKTNEETSKQKGLADALGLNVHKMREFAAFLGVVGLSEENIIASTRKLTVELNRLTKIPETEKAVARLGLTFEKLKEQTPQQQLESVLNALDRLEDSNEAAVISQQLLGKQGFLMVGALRAQGLSYDDIIKKYSALNTLNDEGIAGAQLMEGAMQDVGFAIDSIKKQFFGLVGEALAPAIQKMIDWVEANKEFINIKIEEFIIKTIIHFEAIVDLVKDLTPLIIGLTTAFVGFKTVIMAIAAMKFFAMIAAGLNPVGLAVIAIGALVTAGVALYQNWDLVKEKFIHVVTTMGKGIVNIWNWFSGLLDNPFFTAIGVLFMPFLTIPALIVKHWTPIKDFFKDIYVNYLKPIIDGFRFVAGKFGFSSQSEPTQNETFKSGSLGTGSIVESNQMRSFRQSNNVHNETKIEIKNAAGMDEKRLAREIKRQIDNRAATLYYATDTGVDY